MLKDKDGQQYSLQKPNPLLSGSSEPWEETELVIHNTENVGANLKSREKVEKELKHKEQAPVERTTNTQTPAHETTEHSEEPAEVTDAVSANLESIGEEELAIKNPDGSLYEPGGDLKQFDPNNPDQDLIHAIDQELINLSGSPVYYYKVHIDENNYDDLYMESRNKIRAQHAVELYAHWIPISPTNDMGVYGLDSPDEMTFNFNVRVFRDETGDDLPQVGALIYTPFDKNWWELIQYNHGENESEFKLWGKYRFACLCRKYQESDTDVEPTRPEPNQAARDIIIR